MAYNALNNLIDAYIYANGVQAITGQILNGVLKQMVSQLGSGYHLMGVAGPETVPASNDYAMAYFAATAGEYTDFGGITLAAGEVAVLLTSGNGSWEKQTIYNVPTGTADLENTADFITNAVTDLVNYYTKTEVDDTLANYPTLEDLATALADYYTKTEIDGQMGDVDAALADRYTKSETDTKLADYYRKTETYDKDEVDSIVAALSRQEYIVAWDGLSAPDVSAIPAGVTVTYSGTPYTGTLAASASTVNKIYMVWNGVAYDMYGTSQDGGYSWVPMGTTTVDLSQYATKAELSQLGQEVDVVNIKAEEGASLTEQSSTEVQMLQINSSNTAFATVSNPALRTHYISVAAGDIVRLIASNSEAKVLKYGFSTDTPANGVAVTGGVRLEQASINVSLVSPVAGYFAYYCSIDYFSDAKVYIEIPSALGARVGGLESSIESLQQELYPNYLENRYIDKDGNIVEAQYWSITSYIHYDAGDDVAWLAGYTSNTRCLVFYDSEHNPISGAFYGATQNETTITAADIPANAKYIRASFFSSAENPYVKIGGIIVWEKGNGLVSKVAYLTAAVNETNIAVDEIRPNNTIITSNVEIGQDGYYIDQNGARQPYSSYCISDIIHLQEGETLSANLRSSAAAYLCKYNGSDTSYIVILYSRTIVNSFSYTAEEDMDVVMCGAKSAFTTYTIQRETIKAASEYSVEQLSERVTKLEESPVRISLLNPYAGVDYNNPVPAQSHEHSYTKERLESAYNRGIRLFAVSHYQPAVPRYPLSKTPLTWMDYKSREAVDNGDYELVERTETQNTGIAQLDVDSGTINTDNIPQIANAERPYIRSDSHFYPEHFNILGLLWGDPGVWLADKESSTSWKKAHSLETISKIQELLADETMWQFGSQYAFGTINHNKSISDTKTMLDTLPQIFKAMELFNQGYSEGWNQEFRDTYDAILRQGYRIWGTAVVDWQGDWASWSYTTDAEKAEWEERYNALSADEQAQYGSAENYYMQNGRFKFDRGANVLLMPNGYENLSPALQAKEGIKAYIQGRYYMVGVGDYSMRMAIDGNTITFRVSDFCPKIKIITANGVSELTNTDTARYTPSKTDKYVRFEAAWDDGDFIFSNPIFVDLIN